MDIKSLISQGSIFLKNNNIPTFQIDSEILMTKVIQKDKKYIITGWYSFRRLISDQERRQMEGEAVPE